MITRERLIECLDYNPGTGIFTWKIETCKGKVRVGDVAGVITKGYRIIGIDYRRYRAHRLAWFYTYGYFPKEIDHIDRNKDNNCIKNLRESTRSQNNYNIGPRSDNRSGFNGIHLDNRYNVYVSSRGGRYLGSSKSKSVAECIRLAADIAARGLRATD